MSLKQLLQVQVLARARILLLAVRIRHRQVLQKMKLQRQVLHMVIKIKAASLVAFFDLPLKVEFFRNK